MSIIFSSILAYPKDLRMMVKWTLNRKNTEIDDRIRKIEVIMKSH